ncbi:MAG: isoleucine--tRNA ligase, partial [Bacteroidales bacterium]|nr:isoleucine--tRNA ligase [Bacteroidales bacterium]
TTPWTLPSNTALCVGPKIEYVAVETFNPYNGLPMTCILAKQRLSAYFNPKGEDTAFEDYKAGDKIIPYKVIAEYTGEDLLEMKYEQLFPWVDPVSMEDDGKSLTNRKDDAFRVIPGAYVTTEDGTGIVHIAPTFGADDAKVAKAAGVPSLFLINKKDETRPMVDFTGKYWTLDELRDDFVKDYVKEEYKKFAGKWVKNAYDPQYTVNGKYDEEAASKAENLDIFLCMDMKQSNKVFKIEKHVHNYPYCWRTDKPILYYPLDSWFIRTTSVKDRMIELNKTINWRPEATGTGRFGNWLENLVDWNLSRSRFWGTPLPIWISEDKKEQKCIGSVAELKAEIDKAVKAGFMTNNPLSSYVEGDNSKENYETFDLHKPYVDNIVLVSDSGKKMLREPDLIDVCFDSGAMPYAQSHYPFENKESFDSRKIFPADFIAEGVDQTRGWFFTLHAIATMISDSVAFKNIISNGLVLDKNGNKMSKRLGNAVDPFKVIEEYGSDPLRWYMMTNAQPWDNLKFDINGIDEVKRKFFGTLYNTYSFFALYANIDGFTYKEAELPMSERPEIDRWIISLLNSLVKEAKKCYESYDITRAGRAIQDFVTDNLSNWYVRLNRKRFWGGNYNTDKISAYQTLYTCLETISRIAAPIAPFYMDKLFCDLNSATGKSSEISVHLADFPQYDESLIDSNLEERMDIAQKISSMVLGLRRKVSIKVRQPLAKIMIPLPDKDFKAKFEAVKPLVLSEINVKEVEYIEDSSTLLKKKVKPNFKALGPRYGKLMKELGASIAAMSQADIASFEANKSFSMKVAGQDVELTEQDLEVISEDIPGWQVANEGRLTVALDVTVTDELRHEGVARELVNRIQNIRKDSGFDVTDKIAVKIEDVESVREAIKTHGKYISQQTLASSIELTNTFGDNVKDIDIDDISIKMEINKI